MYLAVWIISAIFITAYVKAHYNAEDTFTAIMCGIIAGGMWPIFFVVWIVKGIVILIEKIIDKIYGNHF